MEVGKPVRWYCRGEMMVARIRMIAVEVLILNILYFKGRACKVC